MYSVPSGIGVREYGFGGRNAGFAAAAAACTQDESKGKHNERKSFHKILLYNRSDASLYFHKTQMSRIMFKKY